MEGLGTRDGFDHQVRISPLLLIGGGIAAVGFLGLVGLVLFTQRKRIVTRISEGVRAVAGKILDVVAAAPIGMPIPPYATLPPGPPEIGPLASDASFDSLTPTFRPRAEGLSREIEAIVAPHGVKVVVAETRRSALRQLFLWGIGRFYQASGRKGIVTKVRSVTTGAKHPKGEALDFAFFKEGKLLLGDQVTPLLRPHAARLESKYQVKWGGNFPGCFQKGGFCDVPHFEAA